MKETFYFSHDYNARSDEKIVRLLAKEGWEGYGLFWALIEKLYEADGWIDEDYDCIAFDLRTDCERITRIVNNYNLFTLASKKISSNSVLARLRKRKGKSEQARQSANLRWNKPNKSDANALQTQSESNAIKESKVKENKIKDIAVSRFAPPSLEDVTSYCLERQNHIDPETFVNFYASKGWKVGNSPMKDWKACVHTWEKRNPSPQSAPASAQSDRDYIIELQKKNGVYKDPYS